MPFVTTGEASIFYKWEGPEAAATLVFSSSLGTHHGMWDEQMPDFARSYRVLRYDSRGHGASDVPREPCDIATLARDVLGLLDALGVRKAHFCGLSLGGMIGQWLGANAPERLERLILCSTSAYLGGRDAWNARIEAVRNGGMAAVTDTIIERWFTARFRDASPAPAARIRDMLLACPPEGYVACCAAVRDMDQRELLGRVGARTLVVSGRHDPATTPEHARYLAERIAGARLIELDASHLCNIETSAAFGAALHEFLEEK